MVVSLSLMAIAVREITPRIHPYEMLAFRAAVGLLLIAPIAVYRRKALRITRPSIHLLRAALVLIAMLAWFYGVIHLPLATVFAIEFTAPAWTAVMALIFLGEPLTRGRIVAVVLGFAGVIIIVQPGSAVFHWAMLAVLAAAILFAGNFILTRFFARNDSPLAILVALHLALTPMAVALAAFQWTTPTGIEWLWLFAIGATGLTTNYCMTRALAIAEAAIVVPVDFLRLPVVAIAGALLYEESLALAVFIGAGPIFAGNYFNILSEGRRHRMIAAQAELPREAD